MLQTSAVESRTLELLRNLMDEPMLKSFTLVGGTSLALQIGHRQSIDLDLFSTEQFDKEQIQNYLSKKFDFQIVNEGEQMLITTIDGIKVDFVKMSYKNLFPEIISEGIRLLNIKDIAPMKLKAIVQRGNKKDFYDIYYLLNYLTLLEMLELFKEKFLVYDNFIVLKSLLFFDDAENNPDPVVLRDLVSWFQIKEKIKKEVLALE